MLKGAGALLARLDGARHSKDIDLFVITFSKGFGGIGGAVLARQDIVRYVNWYARCRMFSCALDPAVTGGLIRALELAQTPDADRRRARVMANARFLRERLRGIRNETCRQRR